jgi:hypothetical protein
MIRVKLTSTMIDSEASQGCPCINCGNDVDFTTSHYGRIMRGFIEKYTENIQYLVRQGEVVDVNTYDSYFIPKKETGEVCHSCWVVLYNTTWRDKRGWLKRAFENVHKPAIQPKSDDYEHSSITKGLYAPHASKVAKRPNDYHHRGLGSTTNSAVIHSEKSIKNEQLAGFKTKNPMRIKLDIKEEV